MDNSTHGGVGHLLKMAKTQCGAAVAFAALKKAEGGFAIATFPSLLAEPAWTVETIDEFVHQTWDDPALAGGQVIVLSGRVFSGMWSGQARHTKVAAAALSDFDTPDQPWGVLCVAEPLEGHFEQEQLSLLCNLSVRLVAYLRARQELLEGSFAFDLTAVLEAKTSAAAAAMADDETDLEPFDLPAVGRSVEPPSAGVPSPVVTTASAAPGSGASPVAAAPPPAAAAPPPAAAAPGREAADVEPPASSAGATPAPVVAGGQVPRVDADWALRGAFDADWAEATAAGSPTAGALTIQEATSVSEPLPDAPAMSPKPFADPPGEARSNGAAASGTAPVTAVGALSVAVAQAPPPAPPAPAPAPPAPPKWVDAPDLPPAAAVVIAPDDSLLADGASGAQAAGPRGGAARSAVALSEDSGRHARPVTGESRGDRRAAPRPVADRQGALGSLLAPDPVTGTATLASLLSYLGEALGLARSSDDLVAIVVIAPEPANGSADISDEAAQLVAGALRHHVRGRDIVARVDPDLFAIGLTLTPDSVSASTIGERMVNAIMAASQSSPGVLPARPELATVTAEAGTPVTAELLFQQAVAQLRQS